MKDFNPYSVGIRGFWIGDGRMRDIAFYNG
jgi:hypothetical protein